MVVVFAPPLGECGGGGAKTLTRCGGGRSAFTDIVVACFDRTCDYGKLQAAFDAIRGGARFIATNRDPHCPAPGGGLPDCGAIVAAVEACTGHAVDEVADKPAGIMAGLILERVGVSAPAARLRPGRDRRRAAV